MRRRFLSPSAVLGLAAVAGGLYAARTAGAADPTPDKAAVDRACDQVKMLDDLYKTAVVGITKTYVDKQDDTPAAVLAAAVFDAMKKKGYHDARLIDATGKPMRKANAAESEFEKKAVEAMKGGKTYVEEIATKGGKPVFRAATMVPAVMKECVFCHKHVKQGDLLGVIVYELPVK